VDVSADALALLTKIGQETGLRYASNLITTSHLLAQKRKAREIEVADVQRSFELFYDPNRSMKFVSEFEKRFIGDEGGVELGGMNGNPDAMEITA
ncbi:hypothetical protein KCU91_g15560, partial [Aureobasidium melanogenum]